MSGRAATVSARNVSRPRRQGLWRLLILVLMILILGGYISPIMKYIDRSEKIESERAATEELRSEFDLLQAEKMHLQRNDYIEQVARRDLGLVRPGEQPYVVRDLDQGADEKQAAAVAEEEAVPEGPEDTGVFGSFPIPLPRP